MDPTSKRGATLPPTNCRPTTKTTSSTTNDNENDHVAQDETGRKSNSRQLKRIIIVGGSTLTSDTQKHNWRHSAPDRRPTIDTAELGCTQHLSKVPPSTIYQQSRTEGREGDTEDTDSSAVKPVILAQHYGGCKPCHQVHWYVMTTKESNYVTTNIHLPSNGIDFLQQKQQF